MKSQKPLRQVKGLKQSTYSLKQKSQLKANQPLKANLKPKKQAKPKVSKLKKDADKFFSIATRLRFADKKGDEWWVKCITCPNYKPLKQMQCGHFMSRGHNNTRYEEENCAPQCYGCNVMHQGMQYQFGIWVDDFYGQGTAKKLSEMAKEPHPFKPEELEQIIHDSKEQIALYERQG